MQFITAKVPANFNIFFFGDVHAGTLLHSEQALDQMIDMAHSEIEGCKSNFLVNMGDNIEAIDTSDKRFDLATTDLKKIRPESQADYIVGKLSKLGKKLITVLQGNHEFKLMRYYDYAPSIARQLNVPYGTYTAIVSFVNGRSDAPIFKAFVTHGAGSINSTADDPERAEANMNLSLKRKLKNKVGDCVLMCMGHTHKILAPKPKKKLYLSLEDGELRQHYTSSGQNEPFIHPDHRYYLNTGSFARLYRPGVSGYAERAGYDPMEIGFTMAKVRDRKVVGTEKMFL